MAFDFGRIPLEVCQALCKEFRRFRSLILLNQTSNTLASLIDLAGNSEVQSLQMVGMCGAHFVPTDNNVARTRRIPASHAAILSPWSLCLARCVTPPPTYICIRFGEHPAAIVQLFGNGHVLDTCAKLSKVYVGSRGWNNRSERRICIDQFVSRGLEVESAWFPLTS